MAKLVNESQQQRVGILGPRSVYSRVLSVVLAVPVGPGAVYVHTPSVGSDCWLLSVRIWFAPKAVSMAKQTLFRVLTGTVAASCADDMLTWERVLPCSSVGGKDEPMTAYDGVSGYRWSLRRHWTGAGRMFGLWAERGPLGIDEVLCSFEIAEG
jgi:hypothetical protein